MKCNICLSLCNIQRLTTQNFLIKVIFKALCRASFHLFLRWVFLQTVAEYLGSLSSKWYTHAHAFNLLFVRTTPINSTIPIGKQERKEIHVGRWVRRARREHPSRWTDVVGEEKRRSRREMEQGSVGQMAGGRWKIGYISQWGFN